MAIITPPSSNLPPESMQWGRSVDQNIVQLNDNAERNFANIENQLKQLTASVNLLSDSISQVYDVKAPVKEATITSASGNGTVITYIADNNFIVGESVTISNLPVTTGASLNTSGTILVVATRTATQFTVNSTVVGTSVGPGTAVLNNSWKYSTSYQEPGGGGSSYYPYLLMSLPNGRDVSNPGAPYETGTAVTLNRGGRIIIDISAYANLYFSGGPVDSMCFMYQYYSINNGPWIECGYIDISIPNTGGPTTYSAYNNSKISGSDVVTLPAGTHSIRCKWAATNRGYGDIIINNINMRITTI